MAAVLGNISASLERAQGVRFHGREALYIVMKNRTIIGEVIYISRYFAPTLNCCFKSWADASETGSNALILR
jgi:hypothetical protein